MWNEEILCVPLSGMILSSEYTIETIGIIKHFYSNLCFFGGLGIINLFDWKWLAVNVISRFWLFSCVFLTMYKQPKVWKRQCEFIFVPFWSMILKYKFLFYYCCIGICLSWTWCHLIYYPSLFILINGNSLLLNYFLFLNVQVKFMMKSFNCLQ